MLVQAIQKYKEAVRDPKAAPTDHENCDRSEDGAVRRSGKLSGRGAVPSPSRLVFRIFERSAEAANSGDYLTKISGKIGRFATAVVGQSVLGQPP